MMHTLLEIAKEYRLVLSSSVLVCLFLTAFGRAPVFPVILGGVLAIGIAVLRTERKVFTRGSK